MVAAESVMAEALVGRALEKAVLEAEVEAEH